MSSADLPAAVPSTSCQTRTAPGPAGTTADYFRGQKEGETLAIVLRLCHRRPLSAAAEKDPLQPCQTSVPTKGMQVLANAIVFLKKFAFPVHFVSP